MTDDSVDGDRTDRGRSDPESDGSAGASGTGSTDTVDRAGVGPSEVPGTDSSTTEADTSADRMDRIPLDLSSDRVDDSDATTGDTRGSIEEDADAYRPEPSSEPIEPGSPSLENAVFVLLGVLLTLLVIYQMVTVVTV